MHHGEEYFVTVTAINSVYMTSNAFSDAVGVDLTPPQAGMVVDLNSVYRIDASSTDNTVSMNAKICLTEEGMSYICQQGLNVSKNYRKSVKLLWCLGLVKKIACLFRMPSPGCHLYRVPNLPVCNMDTVYWPRVQNCWVCEFFNISLN